MLTEKLEVKTRQSETQYIIHDSEVVQPEYLSKQSLPINATQSVGTKVIGATAKGDLNSGGNSELETAQTELSAEKEIAPQQTNIQKAIATIQHDGTPKVDQNGTNVRNMLDVKDPSPEPVMEKRKGMPVENGEVRVKAQVSI